MKKRFKKIYIEITNCCNLSCSFCPPVRRAPHFMSPGDFSHILSEIKPWTDYIYLHVKGEPLLHPQLALLLTQARQQGFYVNITTNGTLLKKTQGILLNSQIRQINISLHSFEANSHRESETAFKDYVMSAIDFSRKFSPNHGITAFRLWNLSSEKSAESDRKNNTKILHMLTDSFGYTGLPDPGDYINHDLKLGPKTFLSFDREFQWPSMDSSDLGPHGSCLALKSHAAILCDGTVVPCCLDGNGIINLGNVLKQSFESIVDSPKSRSIVKGFQNHTAIEPLCRRCGYRTRFTHNQ